MYWVPHLYDHISYVGERCYDQKSNVEYSQWSTNPIPGLGLVMWAHIATDLGLGLVLGLTCFSNLFYDLPVCPKSGPYVVATPPLNKYQSKHFIANQPCC